MQNTVGILHQHNMQIDYPTEPDWKQFTLKLNARLAALPPPVAQLNYSGQMFNWLRKVITPQPAWVTSLAAVATLILLIFQGSIISSSFLSHKIMSANEIRTFTQNIPDYNQPLEQRIALTKYVFEKTNS